MSATIYVMEAANMICGDIGTEAAPGISTHLQLAELKLPGLEENYVDHLPGGAPIAIEVPTHMNRLEATFNLTGWQPDVMGLIAQADTRLQIFTAYGLIRDRRSGEALQAMAVMKGRLGRVNPTNFRRGDLMQHEYSIRSIVSYQLSMAQETGGTLLEIYYWDYFSSEFRVTTAGITRNVNADLIDTLNIPGTAVENVVTALG